MLAGWAAGLASGVYWLAAGGFASSLATYPIGGSAGTKLYIGFVAFLINIAVTVGWSAIAAALRRGRTGTGELRPVRTVDDTEGTAAGAT